MTDERNEQFKKLCIRRMAELDGLKVAIKEVGYMMREDQEKERRLDNLKTLGAALLITTVFVVPGFIWGWNPIQLLALYFVPNFVYKCWRRHVPWVLPWEKPEFIAKEEERMKDL